MMSTGEGSTSSFIRELEVGEHLVQIKQLYVGDVGCVVWDAAIVLCKFLENEYYFPAQGGSASVNVANEYGEGDHEATSVSQTDSRVDSALAAQSYWAGKRVIDLGSGTGAVGIAAAVLG